jgi:hypothetical protein
MAASGTMILTGDADRAPLRISLPQAWLHASAEAAGATLIAMYERDLASDNMPTFPLSKPRWSRHNHSPSRR